MLGRFMNTIVLSFLIWGSMVLLRFFITLVRTIPGLWSRMCSRVAAISISLTPMSKQNSKLSMRYLLCDICFLQVNISSLDVHTFSHAV